MLRHEGCRMRAKPPTCCASSALHSSCYNRCFPSSSQGQLPALGLSGPGAAGAQQPGAAGELRRLQPQLQLHQRRRLGGPPLQGEVSAWRRRCTGAPPALHARCAVLRQPRALCTRAGSQPPAPLCHRYIFMCEIGEAMAFDSIFVNSTNSTFTFYPSPANASAAESICNAAGGHLATYTTLVEQNEVGPAAALLLQVLLLSASLGRGSSPPWRPTAHICHCHVAAAGGAALRWPRLAAAQLPQVLLDRPHRHDLAQLPLAGAQQHPLG
jgi:hypothetical protein